MVEYNSPSAYADIRLITGDQRHGKSTVGVGLALEPYHDHLNGLKCASGQIVKAAPLNKDDKVLLRKLGIYPSKLELCRIFSDDGIKSKIIRIPSDCIRLSPVHIFANFHMYGVIFSRISLVDIIQYMNTELFNEAWILLDESGVASARRSMESLGKLLAEFSATIGKRKAHFCVMAQYNRMVELYIRLFATTRILCTYDEHSRYITCEVERRGDPKFSFDFWQPAYRAFFNTSEIIETPQYRIDRALGPVFKERAFAGVKE